MYLDRFHIFFHDFVIIAIIILGRRQMEIMTPSQVCQLSSNVCQPLVQIRITCRTDTFGV